MQRIDDRPNYFYVKDGIRYEKENDMKKIGKIFSLLVLAGAMIVLLFGSVNAMAATNGTVAVANEYVLDGNELSVKQLTDGMESGEVQTILWNENTEREHLDSEAYSIWVNDTYDGSEYVVSEYVYQIIKSEAIKNDVEMITLPCDGDVISKNDFSDICAYINVDGTKVEKNGFTGYRCVIDTSIGEMRVNFKDLDELQNFAATYKLSVGEAINTTENKLYNIAFVAMLAFLAVFIGLLIKSNVWGCSELEDIILTVSMIGFLILFVASSVHELYIIRPHLYYA